MSLGEKAAYLLTSLVVLLLVLVFGISIGRGLQDGHILDALLQTGNGDCAVAVAKVKP
jgi:hypothetical protein